VYIIICQSSLQTLPTNALLLIENITDGDSIDEGEGY